jgi:spore germination protein YaaH
MDRRLLRRCVVVAALVVGATGVARADAPAGAAVVRAGSVTGWLPYFNAPATIGVRSMEAAVASGTMSEVMPFWFSATGATTLRPAGSASTLATVVRAARARGLLVIPSVTDGTPKLGMQAILGDPASRTAHVDTLVGLVTAGVDAVPFDGIDIDYEGFAFTDGRATWPQTQPLWLAFVKELGEKLHAHGKLLSITVPPMWDDGRGATAGYTVYGPWNQVTPYADRLRLMVYDWSVGAPGPIAPMSWVRNVVSYAQRTLPPADHGKVWLGVPAYGRSWARITGECPTSLPVGVSVATTSVQTAHAAELARAHGATVTETRGAGGTLEGETTFSWQVTDPATGSTSFKGIKTINPAPPAYEPSPAVASEVPGPADSAGLAAAVRVKPVSVTVTCSIRRVVHVPDTSSIVQRAQLAQAAGLGGTVVWALGYETPDLWQALAAAG